MKVLVTSGGTKVPIDPVRDITNLSNGTFGSKIAKSLLQRGHNVLFLRGKKTCSPLEMTIDFNDVAIDRHRKNFEHFLDYANQVKDNYHEVLFRNYEDYRENLLSAIGDFKPDVIILTAAVSDYLVKKSESKIRSSEQLTINLTPAPKIITEIKKTSPSSKLVGFKLLVDSPVSDLTDAMKQSIIVNDCDLVVGNLLKDIKVGNHRLYIMNKDFSFSTYDKNDLENSQDGNLSLADYVAIHSEKLCD